MNTNRKPVTIIGAGLAGSEAALQLAQRGVPVVLYEMRPTMQTDVHKTGYCAELVCSNSLKSLKPESAAGMLKHELSQLGSFLFEEAQHNAVPAGGALAVNRDAFAAAVTALIEKSENIEVRRAEVRELESVAEESSAIVLATGPLTSDALASSLEEIVGGYLAFYDAAAPIVMADGLDMDVLFRQSRYETDAQDASNGSGSTGDYLNAPFNREEYDRFIDELVEAKRVIARDFESKELFQACQPIEEIARTGRDAPRFGPLKPVGLVDPRTGRRPWAALQLRAEDEDLNSYNLVGFQTNLTFGEQKRVFRMIPGLENAEFARFGVMHRNTFIDAPRLLDSSLRLKSAAASELGVPVFVAGQLGGTEGYCEAIRSGLHVSLSIAAFLANVDAPSLPRETAFGALIKHATDPETANYQPMHVNFGIMPALDPPIRNKRERYRAYAERGSKAMERYCSQLNACGLLPKTGKAGSSISPESEA